ncbi:MAG: hypothetical protein Athens101410_45 [Parcubacteria group bacterium Athens1014_10]|nr:MAG: hypothetical protein Athens101410_45 [Parcubacteria group bacterium Athens1014_10]TSD06071.1 MAG: hypothetical protein Athens071412_45 [Parcubacteria group bacterium Athens0714_12]
MSKFYFSILTLIVIIGAVTAATIFKIKTSEKNKSNSVVISQSSSLEEINELIAQANNYEAKLKIIAPSDKTYLGYVYVSSDKIKISYQIKEKIFFSVSDLNKNEIINYELKNKTGVKMPVQTEKKETLFKKLPVGAKIIKENEIFNNLNCWVVEIKKGNEIETLWISKDDGIIIKKEIINFLGTTIFELTEIENKEITEKETEIPEGIEIMDLTSEEFISFVQENPNDAAIITSLPSLPASSVEPAISPYLSTEFTGQSIPTLKEQEFTNSSYPNVFDEGIYEETNPHLPSEIIPSY